jgi:hypothetical protein
VSRFSLNVLRGCENALVRTGFERVAAGLLTRRLSAAFAGSIGLNASRTGSGAIGVNPVVGVRWHAVEELLETLGYEGAGPWSNTIYTPLETLVQSHGELMWWYGEPADVAPVSEEIAEAVASCALPFMESQRRPETCLHFIEHDLPREQRAYRLPAALTVCQRTDDARKALERGLKLAGTRSNPWAVAYREFADRLTRL